MLPLLLAAALLLPNPHHTAHVTQAAADHTPDVAGTYAGTLPCADCSGFATRLTLTAALGSHGRRGTYMEVQMPNMGESWTTAGGTHISAAPTSQRGTWELKPGVGTDGASLLVHSSTPSGGVFTETYHLRDGALFYVDGLGKEDAVLLHMVRLRDGHEYPELEPYSGLALLPR